MSYPIQYVIVSALFDPSLICSVVNVQNDRDYAFCISAIIASNIIACLGKKMFKLMYRATLGKDKGGGGGGRGCCRNQQSYHVTHGIHLDSSTPPIRYMGSLVYFNFRLGTEN